MAQYKRYSRTLGSACISFVSGTDVLRLRITSFMVPRSFFFVSFADPSAWILRVIA